MTPFDAALDRLVQSMHGLRRSPKTIEDYRNTLRRLHAAHDLTRPAQAFRAWHTDAITRFERDEISVSKVRNEHVALRVMFDTMRVKPNPARGTKILPQAEWEPKAIPLADVQRLMDAVPLRDALGQLNPAGLRDRVVMELCYNGLRNAEVCRLTTTDVLYNGEERTLVLHVRGKATRGHPGGKWRHVPLAPHSADVLAWYLLLRFGAKELHAWLDEFRRELTARKEDAALAPLLAVDRLVRKRFQDATAEPLVAVQSARMVGGTWNPARRRMEDGQYVEQAWPLNQRACDRIFEKYRRAAGLPERYTPHTFRHSCATELMRRHVDIKKIGELLGHSSPVITQRYTKIVLDDKAEAMRSLPSAGRRVS